MPVRPNLTAGPGLDAALPLLSVVMPVRNEGAFITRSLGSVVSQSYPADRVEIIVADGMSTDDTRPLVQEWARRDPRISLIDNPGRIVSTGINRAIAVARGTIIVRIDGHCEIAPDYLERCVHHLSMESSTIVGGIVTTIGQTPTAKAIALAMSSSFGVGNSAFRTGQLGAYIDTVAFPAYPRDILERAGPFDEELVRNQDDEYSYRLRKMGVRIKLAADIQSQYYSRTSLRRLCRQYFQYGYWKVRVMQKHARQMRPRQFAPPAFVAALLASAVVAPFQPWWALAFLTAVGGLYGAANLVAAVLTARHGAWEALPYLPAAFACLHVSYGAGFLLGLAKFWNRWGDVSSLPQTTVRPQILP